MRRFPDWPERLAALIDSRMGEPFQWGAHDCGLFACAVAEAITGQHPAPWLTGYATEDELVSLLGARGGLEEAAATAMEEFGSVEILPSLAQRGDWLLLEHDNEVLMGVALGARFAAPGPDGLRLLPLDRLGIKVLRAWRIG